MTPGSSIIVMVQFVLLVVLGVREDGQKVLLAINNMGGETSEAWRAVLDDLVKRELRKPQFLIVDGGTGLEQALAALWGAWASRLRCLCTVQRWVGTSPVLAET